MQNGNVRLIVNGFNFEFTKEDQESIHFLDVSTASFKNKLVNGEVKAVAERFFEIHFQGRVFQVQIKNNLDQLIDSMGLSQTKSVKIAQIKAPMPGLVLRIAAQEGDTLNENDQILVLEAMKMENVLRIPHEAVIKKILVKEGQAVEKGQVLIELQ